MTELSFLISLLLNEKLPLELKQLVAERIKEVEARLQPVVVPRGTQVYVPPEAVGARHITLTNQAPSTQRILDEMAMDLPPQEAPAVIAQTPMAAQALNQRAQAIARGVSGKPEPGRTSPRKF